MVSKQELEAVYLAYHRAGAADRAHAILGRLQKLKAKMSNHVYANPRPLKALLPPSFSRLSDTVLCCRFAKDYQCQGVETTYCSMPRYPHLWTICCPPTQALFHVGGRCERQGLGPGLCSARMSCAQHLVDQHCAPQRMGTSF
jgi:hypothetical protein